MNCALIVEEFYRNNKDLNKPTYMAFIDAKSAFDVVVHVYKPHEETVRGAIDKFAELLYY